MPRAPRAPRTPSAPVTPQPRNIAAALMALPRGSIEHDELTELALSMLSDLHNHVAKDNAASIAAKSRTLELLLKVMQDKREAASGSRGASLEDILRRLQ